MFTRILLIAGLVSAGLLLIIVTTTTPVQAGAFGIFAVFFLSYVMLVSATTYMLWFFVNSFEKISNILHLRIRKKGNLSLKKSYYFGSVIALGPVLMISLNSVGGVSIYNTLLVVLLLGLGCLYVARRTN